MAGSTAEIIKEKLDIAEFLKGYIQLQPAGRNFKALCPFHKEKSPSFMISTERQNWHCFGCNLGGDIFTFLMRYENIEFAEALRILADKAGVELQRLNPGEHKYFGLLYELNEFAKDFFVSELKNFKPAQEYLLKRGLKEETIKEFGIGFAPSSPDPLNIRFLNAGYDPADVLRSGLAVKTERGRQFDRFRGRIMFPISNTFGKVVGFTGRILPEFDTGQFGKYINSPETPIFNKSKLLYGFDKTKEFIREAKSVFLVEGQMDLVMSWQAGVKNVVASSGTALTADHLKSIKRITDELIITFDSDEAGLNAGERAIDLAQGLDFNVKVVVFSKFKDPADAVAASPDNLIGALALAKPAPEFYFQRYLSNLTGDFRSRDHINSLRIVLKKLKAITSPVQRQAWLLDLSKKTGVDLSVLIEELDKLELPKSLETKEPENIENQQFLERKISRKDLITERLISATLVKQNFEVLADVVNYFSPAYINVLNFLKSGEKKNGDLALESLINLISLRSEEISEVEFTDLKKHLAKEYLSNRRAELTSQIKMAEAKNDEELLRLSIEELQKLSRI